MDTSEYEHFTATILQRVNSFQCIAFSIPQLGHGKKKENHLFSYLNINIYRDLYMLYICFPEVSLLFIQTEILISQKY